ncbi:DUF1295 domain-containing protein [Paraconexibacter algicola]|uniref:Uncharacterized protein n=1 Tax=Paraconexibacter algicola TaxID=2133960 RepID=A0A2T4UJB7_9ACTN|nr:DUF1295 domain-containing protein [Paraconexibacter algicola]PTL59319.1 hypothetical protein C7Y72_06465 [Paraconexibacter algicola]
MGTVLIAAAASVAVLMLGTWLLSLRLKDVSIVDPVWGFAYVVVAAAAFLAGDGDDGRRLLLLVIVGLWGLRLGLYLTRRKLHEKGEDYRYVEMREKHGDRFPLVSLGMVFGLQGVLVLLVSLPVTAAAAQDDAVGALAIAGVALWAVGLFFEAVGDAQLARFKADPANKGKVMDRGLWRYTRHPNYFGDFCVWWGIYLVALESGAWWTVVGPLIMTQLLTKTSGKERLEKTIGSRREGYAEYVERTSGFFPLPPRSGLARRT